MKRTKNNTLTRTTAATPTQTPRTKPCADPTDVAGWQSLYTMLQHTLGPDLAALDRADLLAVNVDISTAVSTALGVVPVLEVLRPEVEALGVTDMTRYDRITDYARFASYAHGGYLATVNAPDTLAAVHAEALVARDALLVHCDPLAEKKLLDPQFLSEVRAGQGYHDTATDLLAIARAVRAIWPKIEGRTLIERSEIVAAEQYASSIFDGIGAREKRAESLTKQATERQLAFTLFARAYDEVRRVITFLRWNEGDVDALVPSLYAKGGATRHKAKELEQEPAPAAPSAPANPKPADSKPADSNANTSEKRGDEAKPARPLPLAQDPPFAKG